MADIYPRNMIQNLKGSKAILFPESESTGNLLNFFLFYPIPDSRQGQLYGRGSDYLVIRYHNVQKNSYEDDTTMSELESKAGLDLTRVNQQIFSVLCDSDDTIICFYYITGDMTASFSDPSSFLYNCAATILTYSFDDTTVRYAGGKPYVYVLLQSDFREVVSLVNNAVKIRSKNDFRKMLDLKASSEDEPYSVSDPLPSFPQTAKDFIKIEAAKLIASVEGALPVSYPGFHPAIIEGTVAIFSKDDDMYFATISNPAMTFVANSSPSTSFVLQNIKSIKNMLRISNKTCSTFQSTPDIPPFTTRATQVFSSGFDWRRYALINLAAFIDYYYDTLVLKENTLVSNWYSGVAGNAPSIPLLTWIIVAVSTNARSSYNDAEIVALQNAYTKEEQTALRFLWNKISERSIRYVEPYLYFAKDSALPESTTYITEWQETVYTRSVFPDISLTQFDYVLPRAFMHANTPDIQTGTDVLGKDYIDDLSLTKTYTDLVNNETLFKEDSSVKDLSISPFKFDSTKSAAIAAGELTDFIESVRALPPYRYDWWKEYNKGRGYTPLRVIRSVDLRQD